MSVQSVSAIVGSTSLPNGSTSSQSDLPQQHVSEALPKIEFKAAAKAGPDELQKAVDAANEMLGHIRPDIKFVIDESTKDVVIMLVEPETGDVINRYPTEQALAISNAIIESTARAAEQQEVLRSNKNQLAGLFVQLKI